MICIINHGVWKSLNAVDVWVRKLAYKLLGKISFPFKKSLKVPNV